MRCRAKWWCWRRALRGLPVCVDHASVDDLYAFFTWWCEKR